MAKLPTQRTRLPGIERFDVELNTFLSSCDLVVFYHDFPQALWLFRGGSTCPERIGPAFKAALRLALIDPDTNTEPNRQKLDDGLTALGARNRYDPVLKQRLQAYEAAREAAWEREKAARPRQTLGGGPDDI